MTDALHDQGTDARGATRIGEYLEYQRDLLERAVLFWDTLRQRANNMIAHERAGLPALLAFQYETLLDARHFERPANYALLRITEVGEDCWDDCVDPDKPPVVIVDPRAGHGPGIGGFKRDSEVGIAMHEGHPVYFVVFFPEPVPGQKLSDVLNALRRFVEAVARRHPGKPPVLYGNCQGGWAVTLLSASCEGMTGISVLNGSPLSYWDGEPGVNPMRLAGGLLGGSWLTHFTADLGDGRFDGAWLAQNFENLQPEKAVWEKHAHLFNKIDTERERFLEFERWWGGFYFLSREEILSIVRNLFIGNELEQGRLEIEPGCMVDLRRIAHPLVIFASYGDNITPPHQALGWIPAVYENTEDLKRAGQRIVYLTHPRTGHLGIFVSASVARLEHRAILESLEEIEALPPGLYEMKIDNPSGDPDCRKPQYQVRFEPRRVEELHSDYPREAFEHVRHMSEFNETLYRVFASPWVQSFSNAWTSETLKQLHPMRFSRYLLSEAFSPWMRGVATLAGVIEQNRRPLPETHPLLLREREAIARTTAFLKRFGKSATPGTRARSACCSIARDRDPGACEHLIYDADMERTKERLGYRPNLERTPIHLHLELGEKVEAQRSLSAIIRYARSSFLLCNGWDSPSTSKAPSNTPATSMSCSRRTRSYAARMSSARLGLTPVVRCIRSSDSAWPAGHQKRAPCPHCVTPLPQRWLPESAVHCCLSNLR